MGNPCASLSPDCPRVYNFKPVAPCGIIRRHFQRLSYDSQLSYNANMKFLGLAALFLAQTVAGLTAAQWRSQSIYFLMTDRFGRTDNSVTASCNTNDRVSFSPLFASGGGPELSSSVILIVFSKVYCGGTWQGIINQVRCIHSPWMR